MNHSIENLFDVNSDYPHKKEFPNLKIKNILEEMKLWNTIDFKVVGITGTNGKGTTAFALHQYLQDANINSGLFTSPHVFCFNERIVVGDENITDDEFWRYYEKIKKFIDKYKLVFFEIFFLICILHFIFKKVKVAIIEYGIGAKYDCCNIFKNEISIITSIEKDHLNLLGKTKWSILKDKLWIAKNSNNFIFSSKNIFFIAYVYWIYKNKVNLFIKKPYKKNFYKKNIAIAKKAFTILTNKRPSDFDVKLLPARCQTIKMKNFTFFIDGAHNLDAIKSFVKLNVGIKKIFLYMMSDKRPEKVYNFLRKTNIEVIYYFDDNKRCTKWDFVKEKNLIKNINNLNSLFIASTNNVLLGSFAPINKVLKNLENE